MRLKERVLERGVLLMVERNEGADVCGDIYYRIY
jgi:hypothetical protein